MKTTLLASLAVALIAGSASAQKMGATNNNAPRMEQSIELGNAGIELNYTSITMAGGRWKQTLENEASRDRMRDRINNTAERAPLGSLELTDDCEINGVAVAEGSYDLCFKLDDNFKWQIVVFNDETRATIPLELSAAPEPSKRLILAMHAGQEDGTAEVYVAFGDEYGTLTIKPSDD